MIFILKKTYTPRSVFYNSKTVNKNQKTKKNKKLPYKKNYTDYSDILDMYICICLEYN